MAFRSCIAGLQAVEAPLSKQLAHSSCRGLGSRGPVLVLLLLPKASGLKSHSFPSSSPSSINDLRFGYLLNTSKSCIKKKSSGVLKYHTGLVRSQHRTGAPSASIVRQDQDYTATFVDGSFASRSKVLDGVADGKSADSDLVFIGTGTSEGIPRVSCLTDPEKKCPVCWAATEPRNPNRRRNTSLMVRYAHPDGRRRNILVDAGKFFYHSAMQWFPFYGIRQLDAVIITHSHADAIGGLDDLRDWTNNVQANGIPIYVAQRDLDVMAKTHYYLLDSSNITPGTAVSTLSFHTIDTKPFTVHGLQVIPLPVWHGEGYLSLGFRIGDICYISDVSEIPETTYPLLENCDLLILDALRPDRSSSTHFGLPAALEEIRRIRPKRTLLTGMMHTMNHDEINAQLAPLDDMEGLDISLSYDGMRVPVNL